jgi:hypothetical protein
MTFVGGGVSAFEMDQGKIIGLIDQESVISQPLKAVFLCLLE